MLKAAIEVVTSVEMNIYCPKFWKNLYVPCKFQGDVYVASHIIKKFTLTVAKVCGQIIIFAFIFQLYFVLYNANLAKKGFKNLFILKFHVPCCVPFCFCHLTTDCGAVSCSTICCRQATAQWAQHDVHTFYNLAFFLPFCDNFTLIGQFLL